MGKSTERVNRLRAHRRRLEEEEEERAQVELSAERRSRLEETAAYIPSSVEEYLRLAQENPRWFIETHLHVRLKEGGKLVPFRLTPGQDVVMRAIEAERAARRAVRLIILKSRQQGVSTLCQALGYQHCSTRAYTRAKMVAHKQEVTEEIFVACKDFYFSDERRELGLRPAISASNRKELVFANPDLKRRDEDPGLQSTISVTSADAKEPGRGSALHFVHASEVAQWEDPGVWSALGIALSDDPDTIAIWESTAQGLAGLFAETYAEAKEGQNEFTPIFLSWLIDPRCQTLVTEDERRTWDWRSPQEREYAEKYKLTLEQAKWRRGMLASPKTFKAGRTREDVFDEEYPAEEEIAFRTTGSQFFLMKSVAELEKSDRGVVEPVFVGEIKNATSLEERGPHNRTPIKVVTWEEPFGHLTVWRKPEPDHSYIVGGDPAEGVRRGDRSVAYVFDRNRMAFVAVWRGRDTSARIFGQHCSMLGWWYNSALLVIEHNNHGIATIEEARRIVYPRLWNHLDVTRPGSEPQERVGWVTTHATRQYALDLLDGEIRETTIIMPDSVFYQEARSFIRNEGRPEAMVGKHDDHVMCASMIIAVHCACGPIKHVRHEEESRSVDVAGLKFLVPDQGDRQYKPTPRRRHIRGDGMWR